MERTFMHATFLQKHPILKDFLSLVGFVGAVALGTLLLNTFIFKSYNVVGSSMENTLLNDDRVIVDRLTVSIAHFLGNEYVPKRGEIVVFANGSANGELTCQAPIYMQEVWLLAQRT